jgi:D-glycero-D-manno-heptose 1,7-bisphosphate phosphatase
VGGRAAGAIVHGRAAEAIVGGRAAVFLDRDGVLNELVPDPLSGVPESPLTVADVRLIAGAALAAARLARAGFVLVCVTNQPAAAKGAVSVQQLLSVHARVLKLLLRQGVKLADSRICLHHDRGVVPALTRACDCRKPAPGMLLAAASALNLDLGACWMVGDTDSDVLAGRAAGCRTLLIRYPGSEHKRLQEVNPDASAPSLMAGIAEICASRSETNR